jgi:hypothetical protein
MIKYTIDISYYSSEFGNKYRLLISPLQSIEYIPRDHTGIKNGMLG